jgi:ketosteroid isomerase-like protein
MSTRVMKSTRRALAALMVLPLALSACAQEAEVEEAPAAEPMSQAGANAMRNAFVSSYMGGDAQGAAVFYAEEAVMYAPDGTVSTGKPAIVTSLQNMRAAGIDSLGMTATSFEAAGDGATERGTYVMRQLDPQTKELIGRTTGEYMVVYARQPDETFKIVKDSVWKTGDIAAP